MVAHVWPLERARRILTLLLSVRFQTMTSGKAIKTSSHARVVQIMGLVVDWVAGLSVQTARTEGTTQGPPH